MLGASFNIVGNGPAVMVLADLGRGAGAISVNWTRPQGRVRISPASPDTTGMASTMARMIVAKRMWLRIVGAERSGRICHFPPTWIVVDLLL